MLKSAQEEIFDFHTQRHFMQTHDLTSSSFCDLRVRYPGWCSSESTARVAGGCTQTLFLQQMISPSSGGGFRCSEPKPSIEVAFLKMVPRAIMESIWILYSVTPTLYRLLQGHGPVCQKRSKVYTIKYAIACNANNMAISSILS